MPCNLLIVDDDPRIIRTISRFIENFEFKTSGAATYAEAMIALAKSTPDLVLLDLSLPDGHGLEITQFIRANHDIGVIIISGSNEQIDKVVALEIGADDYLIKPFELRELLARVRSVLRRTKPPAATLANHNSTLNSLLIATFEGWICDFGKHIITAPDGTIVSLTGQEMKLLEILMRADGKVLSRDKLMDLMKGKDWAPLDRSIDVLIGKIRKKLRSRYSNFNHIVTLRGEGYKFSGNIIWS